MKQTIAFVLVGVIAGAVAMNTFLSKRMDELYISREKLKVSLYETEERLKKIEDQWQNQQTTLIREVNIQFEQAEDDPFLEVKLREAVTRLTQDLIGEDVEKVPHALMLHLIDQRIVEVEDKRYRIQVRTIIVAERVTYILRYAPQIEQNEDEP
jgi:Fe-S cluster biosynthesis and repair protein YggX